MQTMKDSPRPAGLEARGSSLSVVCMTMGPGPRVAALLDALRPVADEIIVAIDDRADPDVIADVAAVADRLVLYPYAEPVDSPLPWLFAQCRGDWVLSIDDDEIPSLALIDALPELCADQAVTHYWLPRRWLFPDTGMYLDDWPWRPDYQLRLVRTDSRFTRFSPEFHRPIVATGAGRYPQLPLWHADPLLRTFEQRLEKAHRYERMRPGMRISGRALNFSFYVPELRSRPPLAPVPPEERVFLESVLRAESNRDGRPARPVVERVTREEIDARWPEADVEEHAGVLELLETPTVLAPGEQRTLDVLVENTGRARWEWGNDPIAEVRLGSRWYDADGAELTELQLRGAFPAPLAPLDADVVPVPVRAPDEPGRYRVEIDLVHEHVRWLGVGVGGEVVVRAPRQVVLLGGESARAIAPRLLEAVPEIEPILLRSAPSCRPDGYPEAHDLHSYLLDDVPRHRPGVIAAALWRTLRLAAAARGQGSTGLPRGGDDFLAALRGSELLVIEDLDAPPHRRELWRAAVIAHVAANIGIPVALRRGALGDGALVRLVERRVTRTYENPSELLALLSR
jgi:hypothetical protein